MARRFDLRPLDPVRSIKAKLGLVTLGSSLAGVGAVYLFVGFLGLPGRYGALLALLACLVVTLVLARGTTAPLREMTAAARVMAAGGTPPPVRATSRDEVGELARAFTAMASDLSAADRQRRDLLANVAHELRTPVAALRAQIENLADGVRAADDVALAELLDQVEDLGALVEDLLGLARAEAGALPLDVRTVPVRALALEVAREVGAAASTRSPAPRVDVDVPADLVVPADPLRLRQVMANLLDNAARHGPPGGRIRVTARRDPEGVLLEVHDEGPGIAPEHRDRVFERFERGAAEGRAPDGGTGLGLAIARWAVTLHGGRIAVVPSATGCTVRVQLPVPPPPRTRTEQVTTTALPTTAQARTTAQERS
jgi:signal transduction histidine kinase